MPLPSGLRRFGTPGEQPSSTPPIRPWYPSETAAKQRPSCCLACKRCIASSCAWARSVGSAQRHWRRPQIALQCRAHLSEAALRDRPEQTYAGLGNKVEALAIGGTSAADVIHVDPCPGVE